MIDTNIKVMTLASAAGRKETTYMLIAFPLVTHIISSGTVFCVHLHIAIMYSKSLKTDLHLVATFVSKGYVKTFFKAFQFWLGFQMVVIIASSGFSPEIFAIDMLTASKHFFAHGHKHCYD